jgi:hypothetical protein
MVVGKIPSVLVHETGNFFKYIIPVNGIAVPGLGKVLGKAIFHIFG